MIAGKPRVLIVDDDPVSLCFLAAAIDAIGASSCVAEDALTALAGARQATPDLLIIDRCLAREDGVAVLRALRGAGVSTPALATSAEFDASIVARLLAAGFAGTLRKPASVAEVRTAVAGHIAGIALSGDLAACRLAPDAHAGALLDDEAALAAIGGDRAALVALRRLFASELEAIERALSGADALEPAELCRRLHRLRASCGFCGATRLRDCALELEQAATAGGAGAGSALARFRLTCRSTLDALAAATAAASVAAP